MSAPIPAVAAFARMATIRARFDWATNANAAQTAVIDRPNPQGLSLEATGTASSSGGIDFESAMRAAELSTSRDAVSTGATEGQRVLDIAREYLGIPYVWGGTDPKVGLDCSGFVQNVFRRIGVELPRVSRDQARAGEPVASIEEARPGDVIAFGEPVDHIAIYMGDGKIIHAPRTGDVVKISDIYRKPTAIRRLIPEAAAGQSMSPAVSPSVGVSGGVGTSRSMPASVAQYRQLFEASGAKYGLKPELLAAVADVESGGNAQATSSAGARGLMQFMPATARAMGIDPLNPAQAVDGAARYLSDQLRSFGSMELALAAYNAGPGAVRRHGGVPPYAETQAYVRKIADRLGGSL